MSAQTKPSLERMRLEHEAWIANWKASGRNARGYSAPCCHRRIETAAPSNGETWDSFVTCPHCGSLHFKFVTAKSVRARIGVIK